MSDDSQSKLKSLGLSTVEAAVYRTLVRSPETLGASAVAAAMGLTRTNIYPVLKALVEKGMVQNGEGYGSQFAALPPEEALPRLIAAEREKLAEREIMAADLIKELRLKTDPLQNGSESKLIEVLRDPRIRGERFQQLQREAEREVNTLASVASVPLQQRRSGNPALRQSLRRHIKHRVIYEPAMLEHEYIAPYLKGWIELGEEARVHQGHLPLKLALFDDKIAWMPLEVNTARHPVISLVIRHQALGQTLRLLFDYLWEESEPLRLGAKRVRPPHSRGKTTTAKKIG
jgi:HTH-type transcriptional regulator, sugar sensing transcriptional regulator